MNVALMSFAGGHWAVKGAPVAPRPAFAVEDSWKASASGALSAVSPGGGGAVIAGEVAGQVERHGY